LRPVYEEKPGTQLLSETSDRLCELGGHGPSGQAELWEADGNDLDLALSDME
jgi:hypothetical protein